MSKIGDAVKRTFIQTVLIIAIVVIAIYAVALVAPGFIAGCFGLGVKVAATGALALTQTIVSGLFFTVSAGIMLAMQLYGAYVLDTETAKASKAIEQQKAETESEVREHFSEMEDDRYSDYDGPQLGIAWPKEVELEFEKDYGIDDDSADNRGGMLMPLGLMGATVGFFLLPLRDEVV